jgi:hypothetical protein
MDTVTGVPQAVCSVCHQAVLPQYYFCPNCGHELKAAPLSTTAESQTLVYLHSAILPLICFITVNRWKGWKYYKSADPKEKQIGTTALVIMILSTLVTIYLAYTWTVNTIQSTEESINADFFSM